MNLKTKLVLEHEQAAAFILDSASLETENIFILQ